MPRKVALAFIAVLGSLACLAASASATVTASFDSVNKVVNVASNAGDDIFIDCDSGGKVAVFDSSAQVPVTGNPDCSAVMSMNVTGGPQANTIDLDGVNSLLGSGYTNMASTLNIEGRGGNDHIKGSWFNDQLDGGSGDDELDGNLGNDQLLGGDDNDTLKQTDNNATSENFFGGAGTDTILLSKAAMQNVTVQANTLSASGEAIDFSGIEHGEFDPTSSGNYSVDLTNAPFPSVYNGSTGTETVWTSAFNDTITLGGQNFGSDTIGSKIDASTITLTPTSMSGNGIGSDTISGADQAQFISPTAASGSGPAVDSTWDASTFTGPVFMAGGTGNDTLIGGSAADKFGEANPGASEPGNDSFTGNGGADAYGGGTGTDFLAATNVNDAATPSTTLLTLDGQNATDIESAYVTGTPGNDAFDFRRLPGSVQMDGRAGNDTLLGSQNDDQITGGDGDESLIDGQGGTDTLVESASAPTTATVSDSQLTGFSSAPESIFRFERVSLLGSSGNDSFDASAFPGPVALAGFAGNDTLNAQNAHADTTIDCGADSDSALTDAGVDPAPIACETVNGVAQNPPGPAPGPGPGPGPLVDRTAPAITVKAGRVSKRGKVKLSFGCPATETSCAGSFRLRAKKGKRTITVGRGRFTAAGGKRATVTVSLSKAARAMLKKKHKLRVTLALTATDAVGNTAETSRRLTLKPAARKKKRR